MPEAPLHGVSLLCLGGRVAADVAIGLLAEQGANATIVMRPGDTSWAGGRPAARLVTIDLKSDEGRRRAADIAGESDVVIENFRPGKMDKLGLGYEDLGRSNPGLIYCSIPGFSSSDRERGSLPGWEGLIQAATAATHPWFEGAIGTEPPVFNTLPVASVFAGLHAATAVAAALLERAQSGLGQHIEVSLFGAMYSALGSLGMRIHRLHSGPNQVINFVPLVRQYRCADGRWVQLHAFTRRSLRAFARVAGVEAWVAAGLLRLGPVIADAAVRQELQGRLEQLFTTRTAEEWESGLSAAGVSATVCRTTAEWRSHPHAIEAGIVAKTDDGRSEPGSQLEILPESEPTDARRVLEQLRGSHEPPLRGVRVLDLCIVLAGTTCGRTLAEYGAEVIKIDDPNRDGGVIFHNDVNRGKQSLLLDLNAERGLQVFWRLLEDADVVVENFRQGVVERLGVGYDAVRRRRPGIVYVSLNTYGYSGPWSGRPGWEQLAEAATGMQLRYGAGGRPVLQPYAVLDFGTGVAAACGAMLALRRARLTGGGSHVRTSLVQTAGRMQSTLFGDPAHDLDGGQRLRGPSWYHRFYQARDGWFFLGAAEGQADAVLESFGLPIRHNSAPDVLGRTIEERCRNEQTSSWLRRLGNAGIPAVRARSIADVMNDAWAREQGLSLQREHGGLGLIDTVGPVAALSRTPLVPGAPATVPGIDGPSVLARNGFSDEAIGTLLRDRVLVVESETLS
jgi:crotonobetainyl-CoA:carnitine CoA-transferase CaiB-like acyl-CoA transferase